VESSIIKHKNKRFFKVNIILMLIVIFLTAIPLYIIKDAEFEGADVVARDAITEINSQYKPWFSPIFEPASGEIESLLFALQASIGAGIIGYGLGFFKGRKVKDAEND